MTLKSISNSIKVYFIGLISCWEQTTLDFFRWKQMNYKFFAIFSLKNDKRESLTFVTGPTIIENLAIPPFLQIHHTKSKVQKRLVKLKDFICNSLLGAICTGNRVLAGVRNKTSTITQPIMGEFDRNYSNKDLFVIFIANKMYGNTCLLKKKQPWHEFVNLQIQWILLKHWFSNCDIGIWGDPHYQKQ